MQHKSFSRHDWLWLVPDWHRRLAARLAPQDAEILGSWIRANRPLVVGRSQPGDDPDSLRLGLALPRKRRIGVQISRAAIRAHASPLTLTQTLSAAPALWRPALAELAMELEESGEEACVFGSLAWQYLACSTDITYLTADSDLDLLFRPSSWESLLRLTSVLQRFQDRHSAPRLDGEIVLPDDDAVAWREIANHPAKVLAKGMTGVRLRDPSDIRSLFTEVTA
jgi:phosphoribosyl-dephospho-CoA transferase